MMAGFCCPTGSAVMASTGSEFPSRSQLLRPHALVGSRRRVFAKNGVGNSDPQCLKTQAGLRPSDGCGASAHLTQWFGNVRPWRRKNTFRSCALNLCYCSKCFDFLPSARSPKVRGSLAGWPSGCVPVCELGSPQSVSASQAGGAETSVLQNQLRRISSAMGLQDCSPDEHMILTGTQQAWGMEGVWTMSWCMDGRFHEKFESKEYTHEWAYDGSGTWYADAGGRVQRQELDSHEVCLLVSWGRMGFWATTEGQKYLDIQLRPELSIAVPDSDLVFSIRVKSMKVVAHIVVDRNNWLPSVMSIEAFGGIDKWTFTSWRNVLPGRSCKLPATGIHLPQTGSKETFEVVKVEVVADCRVQVEARYSYPASLVVPRHNVHYPRSCLDSSCSSSVPMSVAESGHFLVQPVVDGELIGSFIVDTGASNLAISSKKARELEMQNFGEVHVSGVSGMVKSRFARGQTFELGAFKMKDPTFLEVPIDEVLKGVVGICGYEIFFGGIVEMSVMHRTLSIHDPLEYEASSDKTNIQWQRLYLFEGIPHVSAKINGKEVLLLLDTGAGGTDLMLYSRFSEGFNLRRNGGLSIRGINTKGMEVSMGQVERLEFAGFTFHNVAAYLINEKEKQFISSVYCSGILCGKMVQNFLMVFDYSRGRMAIIDETARKFRDEDS